MGKRIEKWTSPSRPGNQQVRIRKLRLEEVDGSMCRTRCGPAGCGWVRQRFGKARGQRGLTAKAA
ncbi:MAG: hypothetical protein ACOY3Y_06450, partial [Acidobacteriota bacterium]